jgi:hypothetical protein
MTFGDQKPAVSGALARPEFGAIPPPRKEKKPKAPFPYGFLIDTVREHPNIPAAIAVFKKGTKRHTQMQVVYARDKVRKWLEENHPLENWRISVRTTPDTWCERKLYVEYLGTFDSLEEATDFRKRRRREWEEGRGRGLTNRANRLAQEKIAAIHAANRRAAGTSRP